MHSLVLFQGPCSPGDFTYLFARTTCTTGQFIFQRLGHKQCAILCVALLEASDERTYVRFAYIVRTMHLVNRFSRVPGEGAAGSVAPTDGSWQGRDGSRLRSLGYKQEQIGGGQSGRGEAERRVCGSAMLHSPSPRGRTKARGSANLERTSDPPTGWAGLQVHVFVHNWRTLPDIVFSRPLSQSLHWAPSTLACKHLPLGQYSYNYYNYYLLQKWGHAFCLHYLIESPLQ